MGLSIFVGILADLRASDSDGYVYHQDQLRIINELLTKAGLPPHAEPEGSASSDSSASRGSSDSCERWGVELFGYSGLHYLRRVAAHLELRGALPPPGNAQAADDPVLERYYDLATGTVRGVRRLFGKAKPRSQTFDHLMLHSDADGYYVPIDFAEVLHGDEAHEVAGEMVGSSQRLLRECVRLRDALGIPAELDPDADVLWEASDHQGDGTGWQRYGIEAFTCVRLLHGAKRSVEQRAALVFG